MLTACEYDDMMGVSRLDTDDWRLSTAFGQAVGEAAGQRSRLRLGQLHCVFELRTDQ